MLCVSLTALHDRAKGLIHVHLTAPFATPSSTLQVKSLHLILHNPGLPGGDLPVYEFSDLKTVRMGCTLKEGVPCWFFAIPVPEEMEQAQNACFYLNSQNSQSLTGHAYYPALKLTVDFEYSSTTDWESNPNIREAVNLLMVEDAAYRSIDETFKLKTKGETYRVLRDYTLTGGIIPLTSSAR